MGPSTPNYNAVRFVDIVPAIQDKNNTLIEICAHWKGQVVDLTDPEPSEADAAIIRTIKLSDLYVLAIAPYYDAESGCCGIYLEVSDEIVIEEYHIPVNPSEEEDANVGQDDPVSGD